MDDLLKLAERCEQATGPDRELDAAIRKALGINNFVAPSQAMFTASLDATMTLVPGSTDYPDVKCYLIDCATQTSPFAQPVAYVWTETGKHMGKGRTDRLALCAAALRARAAGGESHG